MKVNVKSSDRIFVAELDSDEIVENLKAILEVETQVPLLHQQIWYKGQELPNSLKLSAAGVRDDSTLMLVTSANSSAEGSVAGGRWSVRADGSASNPAEVINQLQGDPVAMAHLQQRNPHLARSVLENDIETFQRLLREQHQRKQHENREDVRGRPSKRQHQESQEPASYSQPAFQPHNNLHPGFADRDLLFADPFDVDAQRRIEEAIQQRNVDDNWEAAIEHNPEAFARVIMLYVDMEVNGFPLKAFVDSGAQSTIISMECAERCGLSRLLDRRYVGVAKGVGQSAIVGRIHVAPLKIGSNYYPCSFTVLERNDIGFIFGLDMLRKHQCTIDLKDNVLWIGGGEHAVPFLQEKDLPQDSIFSNESPSSGNVSSGPRLAIHPPAPVHAPLVQGATGSSRNGRRTSRSPQGERENAKVQRLVDLGFDKKQVVHALSLFQGNEDQAASFLFGG